MICIMQKKSLCCCQKCGYNVLKACPSIQWSLTQAQLISKESHNTVSHLVSPITSDPWSCVAKLTLIVTRINLSWPSLKSSTSGTSTLKITQPRLLSMSKDLAEMSICLPSKQMVSYKKQHSTLGTIDGFQEESYFYQKQKGQICID